MSIILISSFIPNPHPLKYKKHREMREWGEENYPFLLAKEMENKRGVPFSNAC